MHAVTFLLQDFDRACECSDKTAALHIFKHLLLSHIAMHCISSNILSFLKHNTGQNIKHTSCFIIILQFSIFHEQLSYTWKNSNARRLFKETPIARCYRSVHLFIFIYIYMISIYSPIVDLKQQNRQSSLICRIMLAWFNLSAMYLIFSQIFQIFKRLGLWVHLHLLSLLITNNIKV